MTFGSKAITRSAHKNDNFSTMVNYPEFSARGLPMLRRLRHRRTLPALWAALLLALSIVQERVLAAEPMAAPVRPRIGLALSGGGARGLAHVGVLKVLDELHVPVDCVTGTSMGSIVGGAFAAGSSAQAMQTAVEAVDWDGLFNDHPPRQETSSRRKQDDYVGYFGTEFGLRNGSLQLPKGVVAGVSIESFLRKLTASAAGVEQFSQLPIPFKAVAADIETGQQVVMDHGSLVQAMRASMAIPGAVNPVEFEGRLLVDGGIANNLPIELVRQTCADVVIAVNIGTPPLKREEITSLLSIVGQLVNFLGKDSLDAQLASLGERDVLIKPELGDISAASFDRAADAIRIGEDAARSMSEQLRRYSLPPAQYRALRARQTREQNTQLGQFAQVEFEGLVHAQPDTLLQLMDTQAGKPADQDTLTRDLRRLYGRGDFDSVDYRIDEPAPGRSLIIRVQEKQTGPDYLRFGLSLSTSLGSDSSSSFNAIANYRETWVNDLGAEWSITGQIGRQSSLRSEFLQPLARNSARFLAPYAAIEKFSRPVYDGDQRLAELTAHEVKAGLDIGSELGQWGELRAGALWRHINTTTLTGPKGFSDIDANDSGLRLHLFIDQLDAPWFPRSGHSLNLESYYALPALGSARRYARAESTFLQAFTFQEQSAEAMLSASTNFGTALPVYAANTLGGPFELSGYAPYQFIGQQTALARLRLMHRLVKLPGLLGNGMYAGVSLEAGYIDRSFSSNDIGTLSNTSTTRWSAAAFLGADTLLGPAWLGVGYGGPGHTAVFLSLGVP